MDTMRPAAFEAAQTGPLDLRIGPSNPEVVIPDDAAVTDTSNHEFNKARATDLQAAVARRHEVFAATNDLSENLNSDRTSSVAVLRDMQREIAEILDALEDSTSGDLNERIAQGEEVIVPLDKLSETTATTSLSLQRDRAVQAKSFSEIEGSAQEIQILSNELSTARVGLRFRNKNYGTSHTVKQVTQEEVDAIENKLREAKAKVPPKHAAKNEADANYARTVSQMDEHDQKIAAVDERQTDFTSLIQRHATELHTHSEEALRAIVEIVGSVTLKVLDLTVVNGREVAIKALLNAAANSDEEAVSTPMDLSPSTGIQLDPPAMETLAAVDFSQTEVMERTA